MRVDMKKLNEIMRNPYMGVPFDALIFIVFSRDGELKKCPRKARIALIRRLEAQYPDGGFGNERTGEINEMNVYIACSLMFCNNKLDLYCESDSS